MTIIKSSFVIIATILLLLVTIAAADEGKIVVANRASGTISVVDVATDVVSTIAMPDENAEPMYVNYAKASNLVFVGDRANNQVVAFDATTFNVVGTVPAGAGVFHQWANNKNGDKLWVNNDIDNTMTVIDTVSLTVDVTIPLPADLVALGGKPHDIVLSENGKNVFVSMIGVTGDFDYVVKYNAKGPQPSMVEVARAKVGNDPHVSAPPSSDLLYVASQGGDSVVALRQNNLKVKDEIIVDNAHGKSHRFLSSFSNLERERVIV